MTQPSAAFTNPTRLVPLAGAAEHFHVSVKTLRRRIADGTISATE